MRLTATVQGMCATIDTRVAPGRHYEGLLLPKCYGSYVPKVYHNLLRGRLKTPHKESGY